MFKNYLKIAFRYLAKYKGYTTINVLGLGVGVACCMLIMLFLKSEWSFDRFHSKSDRIYRAWLEEHYEGQLFTNTVTPIPLGPVLQASIPDFESACRIYSGSTIIKYNNNSFNTPITMADSSFFKVFDFPLIEGNVQTAFATANSVVITKKVAEKYFGRIPALGKNLEITLGDDKVLFTVSAIAKDVPLESSVQFDLLIPFSNAHYLWSEKTRLHAWSNVSVENYFLVKQGTKINHIASKISGVLDPLVSKNYKHGEYNVTLQPLTDIHLNNDLPAGNQPVSDPKYSYILGTIGIFILLIACINFITLSIGRSSTRALEVGIRKVLGAERLQLMRQFWGEALLLTAMAFIVGIGITILLQKPFSQLANKQLNFSADLFTILYCVSLLAVIALFAGLYPAFVLSKFKPIQVLKGRLKTKNNIGFFRKALIAGQFVASIIMIIGTFTVGKQLEYLQTKDLGFNRDYTIVVPTNKRGKEANMLAERFKNAVAKSPDLVSSTSSRYSMAEFGWMKLGYKDEKDVFRHFHFNVVDADFVPTMGLKIVAGRNFSKTSPSDSNYVLVNEALVKEYGWKDPIGQHLPGEYTAAVIGVVKDFNIESLHSTIKPVMLALKAGDIIDQSSDVTSNFAGEPRVSLRFRAGDPAKNVEFLRSAWKLVAGGQDFNYAFLDDALQTSYEQELRLGKIVRYASFLSIFIACMGLFGLATLTVAKRTKEIGIRKILGANAGRIVILLSKDFVVLVCIASLIAFPVSWWALQKWLEDFAYRINIPLTAFAGAVFIVLFVALLTVSFQAVRAAIANPVKSLRTE